ncbi:MAG: anaerobic sulfatase maturase [Candidatus Aminicenantes bacterium]|nr:MAG: anaerobic sulfatase maturase [Candidatus Aminicenantes bacterium]
MVKASRDFQVFAQPVGSICNLDCQYCYYLKKKHLYPKGESSRMPEDILEEYIVQHIDASPEPVINFSWHGGEPTVLGLDYFHKIVELQHKHQPPNQHITNGMQTNGVLLDEGWCRFLATERFAVGLSLDGPQEMHDRYRVTKDQKPTHEQTMRAHELLQRHRIYTDILCVVNENNVQYPTQVYRFFKEINAQYVSFLPLVEPQPDAEGGVSLRSVPAEAFGVFLCTIFDEWIDQDIGQIKVQIFEEAARTAFDQEHSLCIFRPTCGDIPVIEHNGDFFSCDHYVDTEHRLGNIQETPLVELLESPAQRAFGQAKLKTLPRYCKTCEVRAMCNGGCPKNRFLKTPAGEAGLNYLCADYKRFFTYCQPFIAEVVDIWKRQTLDQPMPTAEATGSRTHPKTGRNDPCPCGSGLKYKKCCLGK